MTVAVEEVGEVGPALREQLLDCWVEATNAGGAIGFVAPVLPEDVAPALDAALSELAAGDRTLVVLRAEGTLAGYGFLTFSPKEFMSHWATVVALQVHPKHQGQGLGRALLTGLADVARAHGLEFLLLGYRAGAGLGTFYAKNGYTEVGRIPGALRMAPGDDRDSVQMVLRL